MSLTLSDSDLAVNRTKNRKFHVSKGCTRVISAGLTEDVPIYTSVAAGCGSCDTDAAIWRPVMACGKPLVLGPDTPDLVLCYEGSYSFGDPSIANMTLDGDVNVVAQSVSPSSVVSDDVQCGEKCGCENEVPPLDYTPIEAAMAPLGCVYDDEGNLLGKVFLCKIVDEETGSSTFIKVMEGVDGTTTEDYAGPWSECKGASCSDEESLGVITSMKELTEKDKSKSKATKEKK